MSASELTTSNQSGPTETALNGSAPAEQTNPDDSARKAEQEEGVETEVDLLDSTTASNADAASAMQFRNSFEPLEGVDYSWIEDIGKDEYKSLNSTFDSLDAKATAIITHVSSGAGLLTLGSLAGVATAKVPTLVIEWAIPSMVFAVAAIIAALLARWPRFVWPPPSGDQLVQLAEHYPTDAKRARALMIPQWQWVNALLREKVNDKAWYIAWSTVLMALAIASLLIPLIVSIYI
jgi:hypothetical protein